MTVTTVHGRAISGGIGSEAVKVIFASSLGTVFEWYDFYLYGSLATIISKQFFSGVNETAGFIFALLAFAAGFAVRPFGALFFGRIGDIVGRKYTFLVTIVIMGLSTFVVGVLPTYASIGFAAPAALIALRLLQGLALGGEYGGAATYVAEHAPDGKRGAYTAWIQTTATLGFFLSLIVSQRALRSVRRNSRPGVGECRSSSPSRCSPFPCGSDSRSRSHRSSSA
jgi:MFS family permease